MNTDPRAAIAAEKQRREKILNPQTKPKIDAVKVRRTASYAGQRVEAGGLLFIWPETPAKGFLSKRDATELVEGGMADPATQEEIEAVLAAQKMEVQS